VTPQAAERRVGVEAEDRDALADAAVGAIEEVGGDDLEVVVGGVVKPPRPLTSPSAQMWGGRGDEAVGRW